MAKMTFAKASKKKTRLRLALVGPSGSGKTYTMLRIACALGKRVAVIDTEAGSASLYADEFDFDVLVLESFSPDSYVRAIQAADAAGYDVIGIDSLSHAWNGKDGALEQVDAAAARSKGNSYVAWRSVTPMHNALIDAMLHSKAHVIATMRAKTEYVMEDDGRGKKTPRKIGMAPIQRDGMEYEFTLVADLDYEHRFVVSKTRCAALDGAVITKAGEDVAKQLLAWLDSGEAQTEKAPPATADTAPDEASPALVIARALDAATSQEEVSAIWSELVKKAWRDMSADQRASVTAHRDETRVRVKTATEELAARLREDDGGYVAGDAPAEGKAA